jgi:hypothetical protein
MTGQAAEVVRSVNWPRLVARVLVACWAGLFGVVVLVVMVVGLARPFRWDGYLACALALIVLGGCSFLTWWREKLGGVALVIVGLGILTLDVVRPPGHLTGAGLLEAMTLTALPPLLAGVLLLAAGRGPGHVRG